MALVVVVVPAASYGNSFDLTRAHVHNYSPLVKRHFAKDGLNISEELIARLSSAKLERTNSCITTSQEGRDAQHDADATNTPDP